MNYFCTKTWLMDNEEKSHLTKFILNNNLELPKFYATKETSGNNSPSELNTQDDKDKMKQANGWVLQAFAGHQKESFMWIYGVYVDAIINLDVCDLYPAIYCTK